MPKFLRFALWSLVASVLGFAVLAHHSSAAGSREDFPAKLSQWKLIQRSGDRLAAASSGVTYELATPLFTDYALKWRVLFIPNGQKAAYNPDRAFDLPVGTVIAKTFYYPVTPADHTGESALKPGSTWCAWAARSMAIRAARRPINSGRRWRSSPA